MTGITLTTAPPSGRTVEVGDLTDRLRGYVAASMAPATIRAYRSDLRCFTA